MGFQQSFWQRVLKLGKPIGGYCLRLGCKYSCAELRRLKRPPKLLSTCVHYMGPDGTLLCVGQAVGLGLAFQ